MTTSLVRIGVEAFYETAEEAQARRADVPPVVVDAMEEVAPGIDLDPYPSLRMRVFADYDDGSCIASDGSSMAALLAVTGDRPRFDEEALRAMAWDAARNAMVDDDWTDELAELVTASRGRSPDFAAVPREARVEDASIKAAAQRYSG